ncbi:unnamed protein product, partial [Effrenium voratum]
AEDLIRQLCHDVPQERLGIPLRRHQFFSGFDWKGLRAQTLVPPVLPQVNDQYDLTNAQAAPARYGGELLQAAHAFDGEGYGPGMLHLRLGDHLVFLREETGWIFGRRVEPANPWHPVGPFPQVSWQLCDVIQEWQDLEMGQPRSRACTEELRSDLLVEFEEKKEMGQAVKAGYVTEDFSRLVYDKFKNKDERGKKVQHLRIFDLNLQACGGIEKVPSISLNQSQP